MNYKMFGDTLCCQRVKGSQWHRVTYEELVRLAWTGIHLHQEIERRIVQEVTTPLLHSKKSVSKK